MTGWLVGWAVRIRGKQSQNFPHALFRKKKKKQKNKKPKHSRSPVLFCFFFLCIFVFARQCHKFVDVCLTLKGEWQLVVGVERGEAVGRQVRSGCKVMHTIILRLAKQSRKSWKNYQSHSVNAFANERILLLVGSSDCQQGRLRGIQGGCVCV